MRSFAISSLLFCTTILVFVEACGDDDSSPAKPDAGSTPDSSTTTTDAASDTSVADTGVPDVAADAPSEGGASCSGVAAKGSVASFFTPQGQPALPITIEWEGCPQSASAVAATPFPTWTLDVGSGESYFRTKTAGYYTTNSQHVNSQVLALVPGALVYAVKTIPSFDAAKGHVIVSLNAVKASCAGGTKTGSTVTAPGHAEGVVRYIDKNGTELGGAGMGTDGLAVITNLDPAVGATVSPVVTVAGGAGCTQKTLFFSGKAAVVANTVTVFQTEVE